MSQKQISRTVMLGIPTHDGRIGLDTAIATHHTGLKLGETLGMIITARSLLCANFNELMIKAYNHGTYEYFCLLHSDIAPEGDDWLVRMMDIMAREKVDVLSVVSPIKNNTGRTSCAVAEGDDNVKCLYMSDLVKLPTTFGRRDTDRVLGNNRLYFNSGLLMIRLKSVDPTKCYFAMVDQIVKQGDKYGVAVLSEDWLFSGFCMTHGISYAITREIAISHTGFSSYSNKPEDYPSEVKE